MHTRQRKPLLIYTHGAGRLGNQLFAYAHLLAFLEEHPDEYDFINFAFIPYSTFLAHQSHAASFAIPGRKRSLLRYLASVVEVDPSKGKTSVVQEKVIVNCARLMHGYGAIAPQGQSLIIRDIYHWSFIAGEHLDYLDLASPQTVERLQSKDFSVLAGWGIRSWSLLEKHGDAVRAELAVHPQYDAIAQTFVRDLRQNYDFLIGVAIRQGDYRSSGELYKRFLFESDQYSDWIRQATVAFANRGRVGFILTADEPQDPNQFEDSVHFSTGIAGAKGHYLESLVELSLCDMLMTSASTFGGWAAFLGNIPVIPLLTSSQVIQPDSAMHYLDALQQFNEMGNKLW
jgi:Glycosyl transferase family 11